MPMPMPAAHHSAANVSVCGVYEYHRRATSQFHVPIFTRNREAEKLHVNTKYGCLYVKQELLWICLAYMVPHGIEVPGRPPATPVEGGLAIFLLH